MQFEDIHAILCSRDHYALNGSKGIDQLCPTEVLTEPQIISLSL